MRRDLRVTPEQVIMKLELMKAGRNQGQMGWRNLSERHAETRHGISVQEKSVVGKRTLEKFGEMLDPPHPASQRQVISGLPRDKTLKVCDSRRQIM